MGDWFFLVQKKWPLVFPESVCGFSLKKRYYVYHPHICLMPFFYHRRYSDYKINCFLSSRFVLFNFINMAQNKKQNKIN